MFYHEGDPAWRPIDGFRGNYIHYDGSIYNRDMDRTVKASLNNRGILKVNLRRHDGSYATRSVAKLMADAFLEDNDRWANSIIHLDGDKTNVDISNLARRPRWFAVEYHQQFHNYHFNNSFTKPVYRVETGEHEGTIPEVCVKYGLLYLDVMVGIGNQTPILPGQHRFRH